MEFLILIAAGGLFALGCWLYEYGEPTETDGYLAAADWLLDEVYTVQQLDALEIGTFESEAFERGVRRYLREHRDTLALVNAVTATEVCDGR